MRNSTKIETVSFSKEKRSIHVKGWRVNKWADIVPFNIEFFVDPPKNWAGGKVTNPMMLAHIGGVEGIENTFNDENYF